MDVDTEFVEATMGRIAKGKIGRGWEKGINRGKEGREYTRAEEQINRHKPPAKSTKLVTLRLYATVELFAFSDTLVCLVTPVWCKRSKQHAGN